MDGMHSMSNVELALTSFDKNAKNINEVYIKVNKPIEKKGGGIDETQEIHNKQMEKLKNHIEESQLYDKNKFYFRLYNNLSKSGQDNKFDNYKNKNIIMR